MLKNKINYKLINITLMVLIVYLLYKTGHLWMGITNKLFSILGPFIVAFAIAYALYPLLNFLQKKKVPKSLAIFLIIALIFGIFGFVILLVAPLLFEQLSSLFSNIISFLKEMSLKYDINVIDLQKSLSGTFNDIISSLGKYISDGAVNLIGLSLSVLSTVLISFSAAVYFLSDMDKIRSKISKTLKRKSKHVYQYVKVLDTEMKNYLTGFLKVVFITLIEYTFAFYIIGHPNAILLGFLAAVATLIPYFGGIFTNIIAIVTAFVISPSLFVRTLITFCVLSNIDGYVINPWVYGKTNEIHPLAVILSVFAGGILFGVVGIIISLPMAILLIATYKFYGDTVIEKLEDYKEQNLDQKKAKKK